MKNRQSYIGGSDVADVFSIEPYGCKRRLFYEKTGVEADFPKESYHMRRGTRLEPVAANFYQEETGRAIAVNPAKLIDREYPFMAAHIDREIMDDTKGPGVLELKCPSTRMFYDVQRRGAQEAYILQLQHYLRVKGLEWGSFGFYSSELDDLFWFDTERDERLIQEIIKGECAFWDQVGRKEIPDQLSNKKDKRCEKCNFGITCRGLVVDGGVDVADIITIDDPEFDQFVADYWKAKAIYDDAADYYEGIKDRIKERMEAHDLAYGSVNGTKVYYPTLEGRNTWNGKALEKDHPELIGKYRKKGAPYKRLSLYRSK